MITSSQFQQYCSEQQFPAETIDFLSRVRQSDPVRRVQGRAGNVSGFYSSRKMGMTIQFESLVELGAIYLMEHDPHVFAYYDQPYTFKLRYLNKTGKRMQGHYYTPDFLVLRATGAVLEEWKTLEELQKLGEKQPYRYQKMENGEWRSPPCEELAQELGLSFRVCPSSLLPLVQIDNLDFLADYFASPPAIPERIVDLVCAQVQAEPGVTLAELLGRHSEVRAHDIYALIASDQLYTDLGATPLRDHYRTRLYLDQQTAQAYAHLSISVPLFTGAIAEPSAGYLQVNTRLLWDGRNFTLINLGETTTTLLPEVGEPLQIPSAFFLRLFDARTIVVAGSGKLPPERKEVKARMEAASYDDRRIANERFCLVMAYLEKDRDQIAAAPYSERTIRRWVADFRAAEASFGSGYIGLFPDISRRGNYQPKAPEASRTLLAAFITERYETPREAPAWEVYLAYVGNTWVKCLSQYHGILQGHTEKELMVASKEIRQQSHLHNKNRVVTAKRLADFLADLSEHEAVRQQRLRDVEGKPILEQLEATEGNFTGVQQTVLPLEENPSFYPVRAKVDVKKLQIFEELR